LSYCQKCSAIGCDQDATDGLHVQKTNRSDKKQYIVPLCHECNEQTDSFSVEENDLVPKPNRIGGSVTPAVLPHHTACRSAPGGSLDDCLFVWCKNKTEALVIAPKYLRHEIIYDI
jgi:hypothetical protein